MGVVSKTAASAANVSAGIPRTSFSVPEFCASHDISVGLYMKMRDAGQGPREFRFGRRVLISQVAAAEWLAEREAQALLDAAAASKKKISNLGSGVEAVTRQRVYRPDWRKEAGDELDEPLPAEAIRT
jgi:hypothetical protein